MKKTQKLVGAHLLDVLLFTATAVVLRTVAFLNDFNYTSGYFDGTLINVSNLLIMFACIISAVALLLHRHIPKLKPNFHNPLVYIPAGAVSVALAFFAGSTLHSAITDNAYSDGGTKVLSFILSVLATVSIAYFMFGNIKEGPRSPERGGLGLVLTVFFALCAAQIYYSQSMPINSQIKSVDQITFAFVAVFFLFESRLSLNRDMWSGYIAFGGIAAALSAFSSIPTLVYYFVEGREAAAPISESVLLLTVFALITARLVLLINLPEDKMCQTAEAVLLMSEKRQAQIEAAQNVRAHAILKNEESREELIPEETHDDNYTINLEQIDILNLENGDN